ncbi:MAG: CPBP family intramembrane metalloprotease [Verrucomicrobiae bacterium]|nr:CPBP family intramembrane metalloprotease [Verrucomicrobiae bacterium]
MLTPKHWQGVNVVRLLLALTTSWLVAAALATALIAIRRDAGSPVSPVVLLVITGLGFHGVGLWLIGRFLHHEGRSWISGFGWCEAPGPALRQALLWMLVVGPAVYGVHEAAGTLLELLGWPPAPQDSVDLLLTSGWPTRLVIGLFAVVLAPVAEEALFRGILFPALRDAGWPRAAYLVASVGFGLIHANRAAFLPLSLLGGFLAWLYVRTGNLLAPVAAHVVFNLAPFVLLAAGVDFSS